MLKSAKIIHQFAIPWSVGEQTWSKRKPFPIYDMNEVNRAIVHGVPGERARATGVMRAIWPLLTAIFLCGIFLGSVLPRVTPLGVSGAGLLVAAVFLLWSVRDGYKGIDSFFKGARGEESVAVLLAALPRGFHVFHDVPCGSAGGIDHVVVGPNGVFVIETKCWAGSVTFEAGAILADGESPSRPPIVQARVSAHALSLFLKDKLESVPACVPVVCFASNTFKPELLTCDDTVICNATALQTLIVTCAGHLSSDEIERIAKVMEPKDS